ncbi:MAG: hypothetical protein ACIAS6_05025, partial [Phycisphaerales bacterium JB060]
LAYAGPPVVLAWLGLVTWRGDAGAADAPVLAGLVALVAMGLSRAMAQEVAALARRLLEGDLADRTRGLELAGYGAIGLVWLALPAVALGPSWRWLAPAALVLAGGAAIGWAVQYHTLVRALRAALVAVARRP